MIKKYHLPNFRKQDFYFFLKKKKKSFYSFQIQPLGSMLMNGYLSCCSPCSMMLQGVQFRFLIFIHQRAFAARFLTFQFSSPKKYNIVSSLSLSLGGSSIHYGARIREKLWKFESTWLSVESWNLERGCFTFTLLFLHPRICMKFLWVHFR